MKNFKIINNKKYFKKFIDGKVRYVYSEKIDLSSWKPLLEWKKQLIKDKKIEFNKS